MSMKPTLGFLYLVLNRVETCYKNRTFCLRNTTRVEHNKHIHLSKIREKYGLLGRQSKPFFILPAVVCTKGPRDHQTASSDNFRSSFELARTPTPNQSIGNFDSPASGRQRTANHWKGFALGLIVVLLLSYLSLIRGNGDFSIMDATEPKFAVTAREMLQRGDWLTPQWNNRLRFDKPPLTYWLMAISYKLFGLTEFATRLPTCLAGTLMAVVVYLAGWKFAPVSSIRCRFITGLVSSIVFLCNLFTVGWSRAGVSDMLLCFHVGAALLCFFTGYALMPSTANEPNADMSCRKHKDPRNITDKTREQTGKLFYFMFFVFCAFAVLTKGPLGLFLPVCIILLFLLATGNWKQVIMLEVPWIPGIISGAVISLPWYVLIIRKYGWKFIKSFFGYHNMNRLTSAVNGHTGPVYYYLPISMIGFSPWIFLVPAAILSYHPLEKLVWRKRPRYEQIPLFLCIWILFVYTFFSLIRTKLLSYVIPAVPAASLLLGVFFGRLHGLEEETKLAETTTFFEKSRNHTNDKVHKTQEISQDSKTSPVSPSSEEHLKYRLEDNTLWMKLFASLTVLWTFICSVAGFLVVLFAERATGDPVVLSLCIQKLRYQMFSWRGGIPWLFASLFSFSILSTSKKEESRYILRLKWLFVPLATGFLSFLLFFVQPAIKIWDSAWQQPLKELSQIANTLSTSQQELYMLAYGQCDGDMEGQPSVVWYSGRNWKSHEDPKQFLTKLAQVKDKSIVALVEHRLWNNIPQQGTSTRDIETIAQRGGFSLVRLSPETAKAILTLWSAHY